MPQKKFMQMAINTAIRGIESGQSPFAACIVRGEEVIACDHNHVWADVDATAHAEIVAIRNACKKIGSIDLSGCLLYSTTEPCPMCLSAAHWARIDTIIYGTTIDDALAAGFNELKLHNDEMIAMGGSPLKLVKEFMRSENQELFDSWQELTENSAY